MITTTSIPNVVRDNLGGGSTEENRVNKPLQELFPVQTINLAYKMYYEHFYAPIR